MGSGPQIQGLFPTTAQNCLVIVTSRKDLSLESSAKDVSWGADNVLAIRLGALSVDDSVVLLKSVAGDTCQLSLEEAKKIVILCGNYLSFSLSLSLLCVVVWMII